MTNSMLLKLNKNKLLINIDFITKKNELNLQNVIKFAKKNAKTLVNS